MGTRGEMNSRRNNRFDQNQGCSQTRATSWPRSAITLAILSDTDSGAPGFGPPTADIKLRALPDICLVHRMLVVSNY